MLKAIAVYDPAMCCSTGVCGPAVDPVLARFASDLEWLAAQGVAVQRFNLAHQPDAFVARPEVTRLLQDHGEGALPAIVVDGAVVSRGTHPGRAELARWAGVPEPAPLVWSDALEHLVAIGAAIGANCEPCLEEHLLAARAAGVGDDVLAGAVRTAVEEAARPADHIAEVARAMTGGDPATGETGCCEDGTPGAEGCCEPGCCDQPTSEFTGASSGSCC